MGEEHTMQEQMDMTGQFEGAAAGVLLGALPESAADTQSALEEEAHAAA
jgi:hypothetical protein